MVTRIVKQYDTENEHTKKALNILSLMAAGHSIRIRGQKFAIIDDRFGVIMENKNSGQEVLVDANFSVDELIKFLGSIPDEELYLLSAQSVLTEEKQKERE